MSPRCRRTIGGQKQNTPFTSMPQDFQAVVNAWNPAADPDGGVCADHPYSDDEPWDWTITYQWKVQVGGHGGRTCILRAHVHYTDGAGQGGAQTKGPGWFWVSGIKNCEGRTPWSVVNLARQAATAREDWTNGW